MDTTRSLLYLFSSGKFTPLELSDDKYKFNIGLQVKYFTPSLYFNKIHAENIIDTCQRHEDHYLLCPLYTKNDFQFLVTGKYIKGLDDSKYKGVFREIQEETGLYVTHADKFQNNLSVDVVNGKVFTGPIDNLNKFFYKHLAYATPEKFKKYEKSRNTEKVNVTIHGDERAFRDLYEDKIVTRLAHAEQDIVGFILIHTTDVLKFNMIKDHM